MYQKQNDKQIMNNLYNGLLLNIKSKWTANTCKNMNIKIFILSIKIRKVRVNIFSYQY